MKTDSATIIRKSANTGTPLAARFRFSKIDALLAESGGKWRKVRLQNIDADEQATCFRCNAEMKVYRRRLGDEWAICPDCGYATDPVGLVADVLSIPDHEALDFLIYQHNLHHVPEEEIESFLTHRRRYERFAALIRERLQHDYAPCNPNPTHGLNVIALEHLLDKLDLLQYVGGDINIKPSLFGPDGFRYSSQGHDERELNPPWCSPRNLRNDYYFIEKTKIVESWFFPKLFDAETGRYEINTSPNRVFKGQGWNQTLAIPLCDVPGHYCGLLFIGRNGNYPDDYVLRLFPDFDGKADNPGFILPFKNYRAILRSIEHDEPTLLVCNNPLHMFRCLIRLRGQLPHPPMVGWIDHLESAPHIKPSDWTPFREIKDKVFWLQRYNRATIRTVVEQDARIVEYDMRTPYPGSTEDSSGPIEPFRPEYADLFKMLRDAVPWPKYLTQKLSHLAPSEAADELMKIALTPERLRLMLGRFPDSGWIENVRLCVGQDRIERHAVVGQYEVFDEPAGIFRKTAKQKTPVSACDLRCFIDHVFYDSHRKRKIYRGKILHHARTIAFDMLVGDFEKHPIESVRNIVRKHGLPEPIFYCKDRFFKKAVMALSRPKRVDPIRSVGWTGRTQSFEFPQFRIMKSGEIVPKINRAKLLPDDFPAKFMEPTIAAAVFPSIKIDPTDIVLLWHAVPFVSACVYLMLRPLLAEKFVHPVSVIGGNLEWLKIIATELHLPVVPFENESTRRRIMEHCQRHRFPIFAPVDHDASYLWKKFDPKKFSYTMFYHPSNEERNGNFFDSPTLRLPQPNEVPDEVLQDSLPILSAYFFARLKHYLVTPLKSRSFEAFLRSEHTAWLAMFQPNDETCET